VFLSLRYPFSLLFLSFFIAHVQANEMLIQVRGRDVQYLRDLFSAVIALMHSTTSDYRLLDWLRLARKPQDVTHQYDKIVGD
jgi:hypothetical protein